MKDNWTSYLTLIFLVILLLFSILLTKIPEQLQVIQALIIQLPLITEAITAQQLK